MDAAFAAPPGGFGTQRETHERRPRRRGRRVVAATLVRDSDEPAAKSAVRSSGLTWSALQVLASARSPALEVPPGPPGRRSIRA
ncbi:hypothetical protein [Amycolatopsis plumensis]|uniref:hypothetical protein n=1 Tax=Amycolatopsis plumensis TaxID=236508 RepID=UPI00360FA451